MNERSELESHSHRLPSGRAFAVCRDDGIVQIDNTEVEPRDILWLAGHLPACEIPGLFAGRRRAKRRKA